MKAAFISGGYLGLIAQVVIAAVNFTFVDCNSLLWQCLTLVLVTGRFDGTRCNKTFRGTVSHVSIKKSFATGVLIRRTSRFYLVGGTVSPTLRWHTLVALETISCMKKKGRKIEREREKNPVSSEVFCTVNFLWVVKQRSRSQGCWHSGLRFVI